MQHLKPKIASTTNHPTRFGRLRLVAIFTRISTAVHKNHWAAHGHTAAEIVNERADAARPTVGLTNWQGAQPTKGDAAIAKNYLTTEELEVLNRIVTAYGGRQSSCPV